MKWLGHLRRITTSGAYVPEVDGLRFIAISSVLAYHIYRLAQMHMHNFAPPQNRAGVFAMAMIEHGAYGLPLFFAISGFLLGLPFARHYLAGAPRVEVRSYFMRRVTRLEPPYIVSLLIRTGPVMMAKHMAFGAIALHLAASLVYMHILLFHQWPLIQLVAWSLEIEVQFYLLVPLLLPVLCHRNAVLRRSILVPLLFGMGVVQHYLFVQSFVFQYCILGWLQFFLTGVLLADIYLTELDRIPPSWMWDGASAFLWVAFFNLGGYGMKVFGPAIIVVLFLGALKGKAFRWFYRAAPISIIGGMCYSLYLTHSLALQGLAWAFYKVAGTRASYSHFVASEIVIFPFLILVGLVFFVCLERPCMDKLWPQKLWAYARAKLQPAPAPLPAERT